MHIQVHGVVPLISVRTLPPAFDIVDDGLAALMNVNMLDRHLLLAFATVPIEGLD